MAAGGGRWSRRVQAVESAGRLLAELEVNPASQVDVFGMCEDLGLWLAFLPMDKLLGAFIPEGAGGVLVTTQRPIPIQRYTAAHEIGHWRLDHGHGVALDGEEHVLGATPVEREQLAQIFAASLLMPPPLVFGVLDRLNAAGTNLDPHHAYAVAREAGVSYEAAVRQLTHLDLITPDHAAELRRHRPLQIKADLALGRRPVNGYADVWPVNEHWDDQLLAVRVEDEVVISLPENRSTGYRWMFPVEHSPPEASAPPPTLDTHAHQPPDPTQVAALRDQFATGSTPGRRARVPGVVLDRLRGIDASLARPQPSAAGADVVGDEYVPARGGWLPPRQARRQRLARHAPTPPDEITSSAPSSPLVAGTGRRVLSVRFPRPGPATLRLQYRSPYNDTEPAGDYVLHALVEPRHVGFSIDQLAEDVDEPWIAQARQRELERPPVPIAEDPEELETASDEDNSV